MSVVPTHFLNLSVNVMIVATQVLVELIVTTDPRSPDLINWQYKGPMHNVNI